MFILPIEIKTEYDLSLFDRFDASSGLMQVTIRANCITISDPADKLPETRFCVFLSKNRTIMAIKTDEDGYEATRCGKNGRQRSIACAAVTRTLEKCGSKIPQTVDLEFEPSSGAYIAQIEKVDSIAGGGLSSKEGQEVHTKRASEYLAVICRDGGSPRVMRAWVRRAGKEAAV